MPTEVAYTEHIFQQNKDRKVRMVMNPEILKKSVFALRVIISLLPKPHQLLSGKHRSMESKRNSVVTT